MSTSHFLHFLDVPYDLLRPPRRLSRRRCELFQVIHYTSPPHTLYIARLRSCGFGKDLLPERVERICLDVRSWLHIESHSAVVLASPGSPICLPAPTARSVSRDCWDQRCTVRWPSMKAYEASNGALWTVNREGQPYPYLRSCTGRFHCRQYLRERKVLIGQHIQLVQHAKCGGSSIRCLADAKVFPIKP